MKSKNSISLEYIKRNYPGFSISSIEEFKRDKSPWVSKIKSSPIRNIGTFEDQIRRIIEERGEKVCMRLFNKNTGEIKRPDIEVKEFIYQPN